MNENVIMSENWKNEDEDGDAPTDNKDENVLDIIEERKEDDEK